MTEEEFKKIKLEVDAATAEAERAQGALDENMRRIKEDFECEDLRSAKKLLIELKQKKERAQRAFDEAMEEYERKWKKS